MEFKGKISSLQRDDSIFFGKVSLEGVEAMKFVIKEYEDSLGQLVNFDKSLIYFSNNTNRGVKSKVWEILGVRIANNPDKYLGLPTMVGRRKKNAFVQLKENFMRKIESWRIWNLSTDRKEVFIESVLQAIPIYTMQCFLLPRNSKTNKGIHWNNWLDMCILKMQEGMEFRDLAKFNLALLAKLGWKLTVNLNSLLAKVMRATYYPYGDFMNANLGAYPSYT
ncbi:reverse transcriptase [Gossypium australe]|uniref:Reverse transcriptase n=1 Tax=Gossypium australe TaxID=47621 RepID=A0A5B6W0V4_9ROSI|nr:reverse transcriptase [Gossypium australe]